MVSGLSNRRPNRTLLAVSIAAWVLTGRIASPAAGVPAPVRSDAVAQVQALARAMYPSLAGQNLRAQVVSDLYFDAEPLPLTSFLYSIIAGPEGSPRRLLAVDVFRLDEGGRLSVCAAVGEFVNTAKNRELLLKLGSHEDWLEEQDSRALREAGAEFGPWNRTGFIRQTLEHLATLGPHWGRLTKWETEFEGRYRESGNAEPRMVWRMRATMASSFGTQRYRLTFEPFEGKLIHLRSD